MTIATGRASMTEIVAVTFTEKAAGRTEAPSARSVGARPREGGATPTCGSGSSARCRRSKTRTSTRFTDFAPSCCASGRSRPAVDPLFTVLTEPQADRLYARAFRAWLQESLQNPPDGLRRALRRTSAPSFQGGDSDGPIDRLRTAGRTLAEWRDFPLPWRRPPFDRAGRDRALDRGASCARRLLGPRLVDSATTCTSIPAPSAG